MRIILFTASLLLFGFASSNRGDQCALCHSNAEPALPAGNAVPAPLLPNAYSMNWDMYEFAGGERPPRAEMTQPFGVIHGSTHYDWSRKSMTEMYRERCIDIFPEGRDYPCQFTSIADQTFFIRFSKSLPHQAESCCLWRSEPFWAPRPDVLQVMTFDRLQQWQGVDANWWIMDTPEPGPFGYGLSGGRPVAFWFPVISGWVQQAFRDFTTVTPGPDVFELPAVCRVESLRLCQQ